MSSQIKRSTMTLYVKDNDLFCHKIRMTLAEKDIVADITYVNELHKLNKLYEINPYGKVPTLITKDLIVYESEIIFEYLEDRFPYPPLLSVFPLERAHARMMCRKIDNEWIPMLLSALHATNKIEQKKYKIELLKMLFSLVDVLKSQPYLLGEYFSIVDCSMSAILYNLSKLDISMPSQFKPLIDYSCRLFGRKSFKKSINC